MPEPVVGAVEVWPDLGYIVRFVYRDHKEDCHWMDFEVYHITGYPGYPEECKDAPASDFSVAMKGWKQSGDDVGGDDLDNAEIYARGSVKFDGCSNWHWNKCTHICGIDEAAKHCSMVYRVFERMKALVPEHDWLWKEWNANED